MKVVMMGRCKKGQSRAEDEEWKLKAGGEKHNRQGTPARRSQVSKEQTFLFSEETVDHKIKFSLLYSQVFNRRMKRER